MVFDGKKIGEKIKDTFLRKNENTFLGNLLRKVKIYKKNVFKYLFNLLSSYMLLY